MNGPNINWTFYYLSGLLTTVNCELMQDLIHDSLAGRVYYVDETSASYLCLLLCSIKNNMNRILPV